MANSKLQIITATDGEGTNCHHRALCALNICPDARAVIGTLMIQGCRDLRTGECVPWAKPWGHHIWLIERDGSHYDPSISNLSHWCRVQEMELPRPWDQLTVGVIGSHQGQKRILAHLLRHNSGTEGLPDAIYLPGLVFSSNKEENQFSYGYVTAWGQLALESVRAGGWDAAQLEEALSRVDGLMHGPPRIKSTAIPICRAAGRPPRSGKGFGM